MTNRHGDVVRSPRDRYIDLLRVFSLLMVVVGHWLAALVIWEDGTVVGRNALNLVPEMWPLTWVFQVMPLFFFVGGFSNLKSYESVRRRGGGYVAYITRRLGRLLVPTVVFLAAGLTAASILDAAGVHDALLRRAARIVTLPLWFLGLYLIVVALAPAMLALHRRFGVAVVVALGCGSIAVEVLRFGLDLESVGFLNYAFVWLLVHQIGFLYADGSLSRSGAALAVLGSGLMVALVALGPYPPNLVGIESEEIDNMNPPTLVILALAGWQIGVAMLARGRALAWLQRDRVWGGTVALNQRIITVFLWHLAALLPTVAIIYPLGFPQPEPGGAAFWALRPVWILLQIPVLVALVVLFGRFEDMGRRLVGDLRVAESRAGRLASGIGALYAGLGIVGYARLGLEPPHSDLTKDVTVIDVNSARSLIYLVLGLLLLQATARGGGALRRVTLLAAVALALMALFGGLGIGLLGGSWPETVLHASTAVVLVIGWLSSRDERGVPPERRAIGSERQPGGPS